MTERTRAAEDRVRAEQQPGGERLPAGSARARASGEDAHGANAGGRGSTGAKGGSAAPGGRAAVGDEDLLALERQVCFALVVASRGVLGVYRPILEPLGLTHPQYLVMLALWERSPRTVTELAQTLWLEPATLSPLLKRLETQGLVTRARRADDERVLDVGLTAAGRELRKQALAVPRRVMERLGSSAEELAALRDALHGIMDRVAGDPGITA